MSEQSSSLKFYLILFIFFLGCLTLFINSNNKTAYGLQPYGIAALAEHGKFYIDTPAFPNVKDYQSYTWDAFPYKDHVYLAKPPAQFIFAAIPYLLLNKLGINYRNNNDIIYGLVSLLTSGLMTSLMTVLIFKITFKITRKIKYSLLISFLSTFGTLLLPYSGIVHHDIFGTFFLIAAFYFLFFKAQVNKKLNGFAVPLSGFSAGFSAFCSYNTPPIVLVLVLYIILKKNLKDIIIFAISLCMGFSVTLLFNYFIFDDFFNFPYAIFLKHANILNQLSLESYLPTIPERIKAYIFSPITGILYYSPIYILSYIGIFLLPQKYSIEKLILSLPLPILFITPIALTPGSAYGWCQYGSRYLIETIPFTMIGLSSFYINKKNHVIENLKKNWFLYEVIIVTGIISIVVCSVGSLGTIYCGFTQNAFLSYLPRIISGDLPKYFFIPSGIILILLSILLFKYEYPLKFKKIFP
ncbi:MAG: hypothetical protein A3B68_09230 [Candidatus Melainabacteria bacterium RIFCSPHIGHO2_02_FULL_34_12]|nr:MAG: hypothetical protein A3B68_09230 [Candidatus Melainabacteria bacterium RIFCSPHIGHO2_02_FULL_34_12]